MSNSIKKQLRRLQEIQIPVDQQWEKSARNLLLSEIGGGAQPKGLFGWSALAVLITRRWSRPAFISLASVLLFVVGLGGAVQAAQRSLPGDTLYPVKRSLEKIRLNLTFEEDKKAELGVQLTQKRVAELNQIVSQPELQAKKQKLDKAFSELNKEISTVKYHLETLKLEQSNKAVQVARIIDKNAASAAGALEQVKQQIAQGDNQEVNKKVAIAILNIEETAIEAVSVIVAQSEKGEENAKLALETKLNATKARLATLIEKIAEIEVLLAGQKRIEDEKLLTEAQDLVKAAAEELAKAENLLAEESLSESFDKLVEGIGIVDKVGKKLAKITIEEPELEDPAGAEGQSPEDESEKAAGESDESAQSLNETEPASKSPSFEEKSIEENQNQSPSSEQNSTEQAPAS